MRLLSVAHLLLLIITHWRIFCRKKLILVFVEVAFKICLLRHLHRNLGPCLVEFVDGLKELQGSLIYNAILLSDLSDQSLYLLMFALSLCLSLLYSELGR